MASLKARVKQDARWGIVTCGGVEFTKREWRSVTPDIEAEARASALLEFDDPQPGPIAEVAEAQPEAAPIETPRKGKHK